MHKKMHKISTIFLSVILSLSLINVAFAKEVSNYGERSITAEPEGIVLEVDSQDEFEALVQEIEEGNARANKMWEAAKSRAVSSNNESFLENPLIAPRSYGSTNYTYRFDSNHKIGLILRYDTSSSGGVKHFTDVHDFLVKPHNDSTGVDDVYWEYSYLDSKRTVAVNTSFIVSILKNDGLYHNYDVTKYIEYYASGGANGY
ncbi:hypothetical protein ABFV83_13240 [Lacrimispora sp. BS-2]|uniref:Uncharacterized protein n=1 Tax=Lacrimispora sp. BS-2 TaxID=3151850 RepID=A0AAU7PKQ0_9FIRM